MASKNSSGESYGKGRKRTFATLVYTESAPSDWMQILADSHLPAFVSPLHDMDTNPDGELKKPHYHVMVFYDSVKTRKQVSDDIFDSIGGVGFENIITNRGYARYLCHLDNPEKYQYNTDDVKSFCGADYYGLISLPSDKYRIIDEMLDFCEKSGINQYCDLLNYARLNNFNWYRSLCDNSTLLIREYLRSKWWKERKGGLNHYED